jgi:hypothetical protein
MSFWNLNDTTEKLNTTGEFESGGGDIPPIPAKTQVKAAIDEAKWDDYEGEQYIKLRWNVLHPVEYKGRKIFQKVKVNEADSKKQDKAKKMLAAIAVNCGGGLLKLAKQPDDQDLQKHLMNKPMALLLQVWSIEKTDGTGTATGNWISAVSPLKTKAAEPAKQEESESNTVHSAAGISDDDIGF